SERSVHLIRMQPDKPRYKYEYRLPSLDRQVRTLWHEIAHIEFQHNGRYDVRPHRRRELEADMTAYLFLFLRNRNYYSGTRRYIESHYRYSHTLAAMARRCESGILDVVHRLQRNC